ncbi:MAG: LLM class flavin-dependent oxidoreductase [Aggregatilineales bacterium]
MANQTHEISIAFQTNKTPSEYIGLAQLVNQYDFDAITVYCDAPFHPSYGPLLLMAPHIQRARLGPAAISPARIHPIDIAADTALLAGIAQGGVYVGIARGAWLASHGITESSTPIQQIRETIEIIRYFLEGRSDGYDGRIYQIAEHVKAPYPLPEHPVPVLIGTWGKILSGLAGELADEVKIGGSANPDIIPVIRRYIHEGEKRANRSPSSVDIVIGAVSVVDEDRERARQLARREVALYLPVVAKLDPTVELDPELIQRISYHADRHDYEEAGRQISDDLLDRFALAGNPEDMIAHCQRLFSAGANRIEFGTPHGIDSAEGIRLIGDKVIPELRLN